MSSWQPYDVNLHYCGKKVADYLFSAVLICAAQKLNIQSEIHKQPETQGVYQVLSFNLSQY